MNRSRPLKRSSSLSAPGKRKRKNCAVCGTEFTPNIPHQMYCGKACRLEAAKVPGVCQRCGKEYRYTRSTTRKYCSQLCGQRANAAKRKGQIGKFGWGVSQAKGPWKRICGVCEVSFETPSRTQRFCGKSCRSKAIAAGRRGENVAGRKWGLDVKGEHSCRNCGRRALHLHHIVPRSKSKAGMDRIDNGLPLCFACHRGWHDRRVTIPVTCLKPVEVVTAVELGGAVWVERNYPVPTNLEQVELVETYGGLLIAFEAMRSRLGDEFMELTERSWPPGELLEEYVRRISGRSAA